MNNYPLPQTFRHITGFIIDKIEGGYSNHKNDQGGATNHGVSDARDGKRDGLIDLDNNGTGDIAPRNLNLEQSLQIYWRDYWCAARCDQLPLRMAIFVYDGAINHRRLPNGGFVGATFLQDALGVNADGIFGPESLGRAWAYKDHAEILPKAFSLRARLYHDLARANSTQLQFLNGWFKRLFVLQRFIDSIVIAQPEVRR